MAARPSRRRKRAATAPAEGVAATSNELADRSDLVRSGPVESGATPARPAFVAYDRRAAAYAASVANAAGTDVFGDANLQGEGVSVGRIIRASDAEAQEAELRASARSVSFAEPTLAAPEIPIAQPPDHPQETTGPGRRKRRAAAPLGAIAADAAASPRAGADTTSTEATASSGFTTSNGFVLVAPPPVRHRSPLLDEIEADRRWRKRRRAAAILFWPIGLALFVALAAVGLPAAFPTRPYATPFDSDNHVAVTTPSAVASPTDASATAELTPEVAPEDTLDATATTGSDPTAPRIPSQTVVAATPTVPGATARPTPAPTPTRAPTPTPTRTPTPTPSPTRAPTPAPTRTPAPTPRLTITLYLGVPVLYDSGTRVPSSDLNAVSGAKSATIVARTTPRAECTLSAPGRTHPWGQTADSQGLIGWEWGQTFLPGTYPVTIRCTSPGYGPGSLTFNMIVT